MKYQKTMLAIIKTGGKQYVVKAGDVLAVEKLPESKTGKIAFDQVLLIAGDKDEVTLGAPLVSKVKVEASLLRNFKTKKIDVIKYKNKIRYKRKFGHRQNKSQIKIEKIVI